MILFLRALRASWKAAREEDPDITVWEFIKLFFKTWGSAE